MPRAILPFLLLLLFPLLAAGGEPAGDLREFQRRVAELLEANRIPGAGIALVRDGEVAWAGGIGYADIEAGRPVLAATPFRIGSITKMFTAIAVMQMVEQGQLSLDQPVHDIAPDLPIDNPWRDTDPVRVVHLLEHTAGFDDMHFHNMDSNAPLPASLAATIAGLDHELVVRWRPGVKPSYSNPGYAIAGHLVERRTGRPFHDYVRGEIIEPLELENADWGASPSLAQGYTGERRRPLAPRAILLYPAGELSASANDMARLVRFFLDEGELDGERLLARESVRRMERTATTRAARHGLESGYGLGNHASFRKAFRLQGHDGGLDGFNAELAYSREHGFGYAVLLNRSNGGALRAIGDLAVEFLARDIENTAPEPVTAPLPEGLAGCYRMSNPRNELLHGVEWLVQAACMRIDGERALLRHPVLPKVNVFVSAGGTLLREAHHAWPTAVFMRDTGMADAFEWRGIHFERSSRFAVVAPMVLAIAALLLMASAILFAPVWLLRWKFGAQKNAPAMPARVWPLVASMLFPATLWWSRRLELSLLDSINTVTVGVFAGGMAFVAASGYALYRVLRSWHAKQHPVAKWHSLCVAAACALVASYLVWWQLVPLRVWAW